MARKDFIISFFAGSPQLRAELNKLATPYVLLEPQVVARKYKDYVQSNGGTVLSLWNMARGQSDDLGRVAVFGFSEGCQGVRAVLECPDASAIDTVIACDGIHTQRLGPVMSMGMLLPYIAYGKLAAASKPSLVPSTKLFVATHSSIGPASLPAGIVSTTETGAAIWTNVTSSGPHDSENSYCGWPCPSATHESNLESIRWPSSQLPAGSSFGGGKITAGGWSTIRPSAPETGFLPSQTFTWSGFADGWTIRRNSNNLHIFGWSYPTQIGTKDPTGNRDHVFQAQMVLPNVVREMLVSRWNPKCSTSGFGVDSCEPGHGSGYFDQTQKPLDVALPIPSLLPAQCPDTGKIIIGRDGDPCWTGPEADVPGSVADAAKLAAVALGLAGGWYGARWALKWSKKRR